MAVVGSGCVVVVAVVAVVVCCSSESPSVLAAFCLLSCDILTCSRRLYLFLNVFLQYSHFRGGCDVCCVRTCRQRFTDVITSLQY